MARPRKATVDYFPHDCNYGKTIPIIEKTFGLIGYAIWFKMLEQLGKSENHFIDCRDDVIWLYLIAEIGAEEDQVKGVLDLASRLGAIDSVLWENSIIASEKFIGRVSDVYGKRAVETPLMSRIYEFTGVSDPETMGFRSDNPQSKVKERKLKETKVEEDKSQESLMVWWNEIADKFGFPKINTMTKKRFNASKARGLQNKIDDITESIEASTRFLSEGGWFGFDWILSEANLTKLLEGNYYDIRQKTSTKNGGLKVESTDLSHFE